MNLIKVYLQRPWKATDSPYYKFLREFPPEGVNYKNISEFGLLQSQRKFKLNNFAKQNLKKIIKKLSPSLPNAHLSPKGDYNLIHCAHCLSKNRDKPWVCDIEYLGQFWAAAGREKSERARQEVLKYLKSENCKKILPWTKWVGEKIIKEFPEIRSKVEVLYPGIPEQKPEKKKKQTNKVVLLYSSRRFYFKGGLYAIEVMDRLTKKYPNVEGWIVSETPKEVHEKYKENKQIKFIGTVPQKKLFEEIYPAADIFLYPSFTDTFGFGITEAMSFGLPVVSAEGQSRSELIENGKTGFVVGLGDDFNFNLDKLESETTIINLYKQTDVLIKDKNLRDKMSNECTKSVKNNFSVNLRNEKLKKIYEEALR